VSAAQSVTYLAMPSSLKVEATELGTPRGTQSSGWRSRCGEKPLARFGSTRKPTMSKHRLLPVARSMTWAASRPMAQASSKIAMKVGGQPCLSRARMPSASEATGTDQRSSEGGSAAKPSSSSRQRTSAQASGRATSRRARSRPCTAASSTCRPGQSCCQ